MSAHERRTSVDVKRPKGRWKQRVFAYFSGRRWTLVDVDGHPIWWARQDSNLQPDRYERWRSAAARHRDVQVVMVHDFGVQDHRDIRFKTL
jgi:hypothetical protein